MSCARSQSTGVALLRTLVQHARDEMRDVGGGLVVGSCDDGGSRGSVDVACTGVGAAVVVVATTTYKVPKV